MTESDTALELMGVPGSPYTRKMLALLRYRRIPYHLLPGSRHLLAADSGRFRSRPQPKVALLPTFYLKDETGTERAVCDTTPLIREFEVRYAGRSVIPEHPALAFIDYLLEDYADEWLTKPMFHYRWSYAEDISKAGQMLPRWNNTTTDELQIAQKSRQISELQISRLHYVGSSELTRETIEQSFNRLLTLLDKHLQQFPFLLGNRPAACDFAIYGQLTCLALFDPTPQQKVIEQAPRVYAWTESMEDLSGYETLKDDWIKPASLPQTLLALLQEVGRIYVPYLLANAKSVANSEQEMVMELDGKPWRQSPFRYQAKCLQWIRQEFSRLSDGDRNLLENQLHPTAVLDLFSD